MTTSFLLAIGGVVFLGVVGFIVAWIATTPPPSKPSSNDELS